MEEKELKDLLVDLVKLPKESEWVEFKQNFHNEVEIGERISALSNGATLFNQQYGYLVFGVKDNPQTIVGTTFKPSKKKVKGQELETWLYHRLSPKIDYRFSEFTYNNKDVVIFEIPAAIDKPTTFEHTAFVRVGSYTRKLRDFPDKESKIWNKKTTRSFEEEIAKQRLSSDEIIALLDTQSYYDFIVVR